MTAVVDVLIIASVMLVFVALGFVVGVKWRGD